MLNLIILHLSFFPVLTLIWTLLILYATLTPGDQLSDFAFLNIPYIDKIFHFMLFSVQGFLLAISLAKIKKFRNLRFIRGLIVIIIGFSLGSFVEVLQNHIPNRSYEMLDMVANLSGILFGLYAYGIVNNWID